nr:hypothetical protein [Xenorhabdus bovienii]
MALFSTEKGGVHHISLYSFSLTVRRPQIRDDGEYGGCDKQQFWLNQ